MTRANCGRRRPAAIGRVIGLAEPPEHVLDAVGRVEEAVEEALVEPVELVEHHGLAFAPGRSHWSRNASSPIRSLFRPVWSSTIPVVWNVPTERPARPA